MWKIITNIVGIVVSVVALVGVGKFFYQVYEFKLNACTNSKGEIRELLDSTPLMMALEMHVTGLENIREVSYDKQAKVRQCAANARLDNGKAVAVEYSITENSKEYVLEAEFTDEAFDELFAEYDDEEYDDEEESETEDYEAEDFVLEEESDMEE